MITAAFEAGAQVAKAHFESRGGRFDKHLYANLVRYEVVCHLNEHAPELQAAEVEELDNSGIILTVRQWAFWFRMSGSFGPEEILPLPSGSKRYSDYCCQLNRQRPHTLLDEIYDTTGDKFREGANLLLLWKVNAWGDLLHLMVVCPTSVEHIKWRIVLPHPAMDLDEALALDETPAEKAEFYQQGQFGEDLPIVSLEEPDEDEEEEPDHSQEVGE